ncbi:Short-chain dehydrogenase/reductase SDR [Trinorchestia longiramus]|nr:Short-chain dehydrogenase/reductase SDR [Trinorchestia longiramus]
MWSWKKYLGTWAAVTAALFLMRDACCLTFFSTGFLALFVADLILKTKTMYFDSRQHMTDVRHLAVFITGCDTGFGNALAVRLARRGFKVYAGCLFAGAQEAKVLAQTQGVQVIQLNVTCPDEIAAAVSAVQQDLKLNNLQLWSVINNAGIAMMGETEFVSMQDYQRVFEVNTYGPVAVTRSFLPLIRCNGRGRVVNVVSMAGRFTLYGFTPYSMSKHALVSFSDGLRTEMRKWNITVHTVEPALYKTPIADEERMRSSMERQWEAAAAEVRTAYGQQYFQASVDTVCGGSSSANTAVSQVIDDLEDAVAGHDPQVRYTPNGYTKRFVRILRELPWPVIDSVCGRSQPSVMPAQAQTSN